MLDEYSLRLLGEIGVDVYVPRTQSVESVPSAPEAPSPAGVKAATEKNVAAMHADVLILCADQSHERLLADLLRSLRMSRLDAMLASPAQSELIAAARSLIVLGKSLARSLGAEMPAQRQNEISWIVSDEPVALAPSAAAKRALWGEIKRLARSQSQRLPDA